MRQRFSTPFLSRPLGLIRQKVILRMRMSIAGKSNSALRCLNCAHCAEDFRAFNCWKLAKWERARIFGFGGKGGEN